jgi:hypothetical protein
MVLITAGVGTYYGYRAGERSVEPQPIYTEAIVATELEHQSKRIDSAIVKARHNIDALSLRLGQMQAHMIRLDALGSRLADIGSLDASEFNFGAQPARGGRLNAGAAGSDVVAVAAGVVTESRYRQGFGNMVEIYHGNGYTTRYAHNKKNLVDIGDAVRKGLKIASMGTSGRSTGPHVHFEVLMNGKSVNPIKYVQAEP